jgi:tripartite motif-containing protein 71
MASENAKNGGRAEPRGSFGRRLSALGWLLCFLSILLASSASALAVSSAFADQGEQNGAAPPNPLTPKLIDEAIESPTERPESLEPDLQAAKELPHRELNRGEALQLLEAVFGPAVESPGGMLDEMPEARFLGDHAAVMRAGEVASVMEGPQIDGKATMEPVIVESSTPLKTENAAGVEAPVDLSLERSEGELQPANPLVEAGIPIALEDGVSLGNGGVELDFPEAQGERAPSTVEGASAFYPNVQEDTDLLVAPVAGGVETMTQLRTPQAPHTQLVRLSLPEGAQLAETDSGGVEAKINGRVLLNAKAPSAIDAAGNEVPVTASVSGHDVELTVSSSVGTAYPILVDPVWTIENFNWTWGGSSFAGWKGVSYTPSYQPVTYQWGTGIPALDLTSGFPGAAAPNTGAQWQFWVPRYASDMTEYGVPPQDFISAVFTEGMMFQLEGNHADWPGLVAGIIDTASNQWVSSRTWKGSEGEFVGWSGHANFWNYSEPPAHYAEDTNGQVFVYGLITIENEAQAKYRQAVAAIATTEISDQNTPTVTQSTASGWWNTGEIPISYSASDAGLGVSALAIVPPGGYLLGTTPQYPIGCTGVATNPCPRRVGSTIPLSPAVRINAATAPEGIDQYTVAAMDPLYSSGFSEGPVTHAGKATVAVKVDHSPPALALSGSLTEQGTLGTNRPNYTLRYGATDGTENAPVYAATGWEGTLNHPADIVRNSEGFWIADTGNNRIVKADLTGAQIGAYSAVGSEQLKEPTGIDTDSSGDVWVADTGHNRLVEFNSSGVWMRKVGNGSGVAEFTAPRGVAVAPNGNVWVADTGKNRIQELSSTGAFIGAFGSKGSGNGQFSEPTALAVSPNGNVWVADSGNNRIEKFNGQGEFLASYGTVGSGNGQLNHPVGIQVDTRGSVWVADQNNGRIEQFSERGEYLSQFGAKGTGAAQFTFSGASGITTSSAGALWVMDSGNNRLQFWNAPEGTRSGVHSVLLKIDGKEIERGEVTCPQGGCPLAGEWTLHSGAFSPGAHTVEIIATDGVGLSRTEKLNVTLNPPAPTVSLSGTVTEQAGLGYSRPGYNLTVNAAAEEGTGTLPGAPTYVSSFGATGTGNGQFGHPAGIAMDSAGNLWVADMQNNRVEEFSASGTFLKSVGSTGTGPGQFSRPKSIAIDPQGDFWVADAGNSRIEEFSPSWEFIKSVGSAGSGNGQFSGPEGIAIDAHGNIWVSDTYNYRVQELSESGEFIKVISGLGTIEPTGIAAGPGGNVWITDWSHSRVVEVSESGVLVRSFGSAGSGNGQFSNPDAVAIDNSGDVWIGDQSNRRVQEFNQNGEYVAQFGAAGTGPGQFSFGYPMGIVTDAKGNVWVSDTGNNRVQRWNQPPRSRLTTEVTLDGKLIDTAESLCTTESCPIVRQLRLESPAGTHTLVVKATDGYGMWTSKTRTFKVVSDTTKPVLQVGGELANAPEGWVQQKAYGLTASANDSGGYGVASLAVRIDGSTVASSAKPCPEGGCAASLSKSISMAPYSGGAHEAEVVANDGAGNSTAKRWTINVDPEGHISTAEAAATLEAVEETSESNLVGEAKEEGLEGTEAGLGLEATENGFAATGSQAPLRLGAEPNEPMIVEVPGAGDLYSCPAENQETEPEAGEVPDEPEGGEAGCIPPSEGSEVQLNPVEVTPVTVGGGAGAVHLIEENAAVSANTGSSVDTVTRPLNDGGMIFEAIRDDTAPETYSYEVALGEDQELRQIDETDVQVFYSFGFPAFLISAVPAHDAIGTEVPTTIHITRENVVTLTVHYKAGTEGQPFVFPIVAGTGWEGGFISEEADFGLSGTEEEGGSEEEGISEVGGSISLVSYGPPETIPHTSNAWDFEPLSLSPHKRRFKFTYCVPKSIPGSPAPPDSFEGFSQTITPSSPLWHNITPEASECHREDFHGIRWATTVHGHFEYKTHHWVRVDLASIECGGWGEEYPAKVHCKVVGTGVVPGPADVIGEYRFPPGRGRWEWLAKPTCFVYGGAIYPREAPTTGPVPYERQPIWFREPLTYAPLPCEWGSYEETALKR